MVTNKMEYFLEVLGCILNDGYILFFTLVYAAYFNTNAIIPS